MVVEELADPFDAVLVAVVTIAAAAAVDCPPAEGPPIISFLPMSCIPGGPRSSATPVDDPTAGLPWAGWLIYVQVGFILDGGLINPEVEWISEKWRFN